MFFPTSNWASVATGLLTAATFSTAVERAFFEVYAQGWTIENKP
jgi:hypothetical protein